MLNDLLSMFGKSTSLSSIGTVVSHLDSIIDVFESEFAKDKDSKNAAIDAVVELLQSLKDPS
jgi:hypothetical protein